MPVDKYYTYYSPPEPQPELLPTRPRRRWLKRLLAVCLILLLVASLAASWMGWKLFANTPKVFGGTALGNMVKLWQPTHLTDADGVVNLLLVGNSLDDPSHPAADLTDSIVLLRLNTNTHKGALLSIPRDLLVNIPGYGYRKINEAYHWGNADHFSAADYPSGGMGLLEQEVAKHFGVTIDYYLLVNYGALKNVVKALGGVDVTIQSVDPRGLYDPNIQASDGGPLQLSNGRQHLDGQTALNLARARGDPTADGRVAYGFPRSDLDRGDHQRQLLVAIQQKVLSTAVLTNPVTVGHVFDALGNNIQTDLQINEARRLAQILRSKDTYLQSASLVTPGHSLLRGYTTPQGQSALIPVDGRDDFGAIQQFVSSLIK